MSETKQRLAEVNAAISAILAGGQSYKIGTRSLTRADLSMLYQMRNEIAAEAEQEDSPVIGRRAAAVVFDKR
jgi:hypothetical protein